MQIIPIQAVLELYLSVNVTVVLFNAQHQSFHFIYTHLSYLFLFSVLDLKNILIFQDKIKLRNITERTLVYQNTDDVKLKMKHRKGYGLTCNTVYMVTLIINRHVNNAHAKQIFTISLMRYKVSMNLLNNIAIKIFWEIDFIKKNC